MSSALQKGTRLDHKDGRMKVAAQPAGRVNFRVPLDFDIAKDLAKNLDVANLYIRMDDGLLANKQSVLANNRTVKGSIDP